MATDRHEYIRQRCLCGQGEFAVDFCLPDHPWAPPDAGSFELKINCEQCNQEYGLIEQNAQAIVVRATELEERAIGEKAYYARKKQLSELPKVVEYVNAFERLLAEEKTATGKHHLLGRAGMFRPSIGAFRKELERHSLAEVVRRNFHLEGLPALLEVIAKEDTELTTQIVELKHMRQELERPYIAVREPLCILSREAFYGRH